MDLPVCWGPSHSLRTPLLLFPSRYFSRWSPLAIWPFVTDCEPDSFAGCSLNRGAASLADTVLLTRRQSGGDQSGLCAHRWYPWRVALFCGADSWAAVKYSIYLYSLFFCGYHFCESRALCSQVLFVATCVEWDVCVLLLLTFPLPFILIRSNFFFLSSFL